jgi:hypothetical protein
MTTKTLQEQWQDDCERLTKPHLQWDQQCVTGRDKWFRCKGNKSIESAISNNMPIRRIDSLELPFDFEDSVNGGLVEYWNGKEWKCLKDVRFINQHKDVVFWIEKETFERCGKIENLRMKESRLKTTGANHG